MAEAETLPLEDLTIEFFMQHAGVAFDVAVGDGHSSLVLQDVKPLGMGPVGKRQPFRLQFSGPAATVLPQGIYSLSTGNVGRLEIFIVPIGRTADETTYEAIFT